MNVLIIMLSSGGLGYVLPVLQGVLTPLIVLQGVLTPLIVLQGVLTLLLCCRVSSSRYCAAGCPHPAIVLQGVPTLQGEM